MYFVMNIAKPYHDSYTTNDIRFHCTHSPIIYYQNFYILIRIDMHCMLHIY